jgi:hypothetical protein
MGLARRLVGVGVVVGAVSLWYFTSLDTSGSDAAAKEAAKVYCLSADQRARLIDAATVLNVPVAQATSGQGGEFTRVCDALVASARIPVSAAAPAAKPVTTAVTALIPIIAGAALAWFTGFWRDERTQSRLLAETLRTSARKFQSAVYVEQQKWLGPSVGKRPVAAEVLLARDELAGQLRKVAVLRTGWREPGRLEARLTTDPRLGDTMNVSKEGETPEQRITSQNTVLRSLRNEIEAVVTALEQPWRWHRVMRKKRTEQTEVLSPV